MQDRLARWRLGVGQAADWAVGYSALVSAPSSARMMKPRTKANKYKLPKVLSPHLSFGLSQGMRALG